MRLLTTSRRSRQRGFVGASGRGGGRYFQGGAGGGGGGGGGSGNFTFQSGWSGDSTIASRSSFNITRGAADLGTGPTIAVFGNFYNGTVGNAVPTTQQIGAFSQMTDQNDGTSPPTYAMGPDGDSWMEMLTPTLIDVGDGAIRQANIFNLPDFTQYYSSHHVQTNGVTVGDNYGSLNEKTLWVCRNGDVSGTGHDQFWQSSRGFGGNAGGWGGYWGGANSDHAYTSPPGYPPNDGYTAGGYQTFRSYGMKPHTTASNGALVDGFIQSASSLGRYQDSSTGIGTAWNSGGTPAWNGFYSIGYYQARGATPRATSYKIKDFYFAYGANAWKRFFLTNASTMAASTLIWDCPHTSWAAGAVTVYIPSGFSVTGKYMWFGNGMTYSAVGNA